MKIIWSKLSIKNLENLKNYISQDSPRYAEIFISKLIESVENIQNFPNIGRKVPERDEDNLREIIYHHYRIVYLIHNNDIEIVTVVHGSKQLNALKDN